MVFFNLSAKGKGFMEALTEMQGGKADVALIELLERELRGLKEAQKKEAGK